MHRGRGSTACCPRWIGSARSPNGERKVGARRCRDRKGTDGRVADASLPVLAVSGWRLGTQIPPPATRSCHPPPGMRLSCLHLCTGRRPICTFARRTARGAVPTSRQRQRPKGDRMIGWGMQIPPPRTARGAVPTSMHPLSTGQLVNGSTSAVSFWPTGQPINRSTTYQLAPPTTPAATPWSWDPRCRSRLGIPNRPR